MKNLQIFCKYIIEFAFGEVYSRKGLDIKLWEIVAISPLLTLGNAESQLKAHMYGALNFGSSYTNFFLKWISSCYYGLEAMKEVFDERNKKGISS